MGFFIFVLFTSIIFHIKWIDHALNLPKLWIPLITPMIKLGSTSKAGFHMGLEVSSRPFLTLKIDLKNILFGRQNPVAIWSPKHPLPLPLLNGHSLLISQQINPI